MAKTNNRVPEGYEELGVTPWQPSKEGDELSGTYIGKDEVENPDASMDKRTFLSHHIQDEEGNIWGVTGIQIDVRLKLANIGDEVLIRFDGSEKRKGGRTMKLYSVFRRKA